MKHLAVFAALVLAGCAADPAASSPPATLPTATVLLQASEATGTRSAEASASASAQAPIADVADLLPTELDGLEAHTFAVAQDLVGRLAGRVDASVDELETAYASEHGERFIQMIAIRAPGMPAERLLELLPEVAYSAAPPDGQVVETDVLAGSDVTVIHHPQLAARLGTFYGFVRGGALIVVQTFDRESAEVAVTALPNG